LGGSARTLSISWSSRFAATILLPFREIPVLRVAKHEFAFSGLVSCGHCGCALLAEKKKGKYVYYHCTGNKGKCQEPYAREEVLEKCFADLLKGLVFDDEVMDWVTEALHQSHTDEKRFRDEAIARLQAEHSKIQNRLD
jgi:site-specific DNA recombinase